MKPCVVCLSEEYKRILAGEDRDICIIQCDSCGFNRTGESWPHAEKLWNGFKVWQLLRAVNEARRV